MSLLFDVHFEHRMRTPVYKGYFVLTDGTIGFYDLSHDEHPNLDKAMKTTDRDKLPRGIMSELVKYANNIESVTNPNPERYVFDAGDGFYTLFRNNKSILLYQHGNYKYINPSPNTEKLVKLLGSIDTKSRQICDVCHSTSASYIDTDKMAIVCNTMCQSKLY